LPRAPIGTPEMKRIWARLNQGKRGSLVNWLVVIACAAVFTAIFYEGVGQTWAREGMPGWAHDYLQWEISLRKSWGFK